MNRPSHTAADLQASPQPPNHRTEGTHGAFPTSGVVGRAKRFRSLSDRPATVAGHPTPRSPPAGSSRPHDAVGVGIVNFPPQSVQVGCSRPIPPPFGSIKSSPRSELSEALSEAERSGEYSQSDEKHQRSTHTGGFAACVPDDEELTSPRQGGGPLHHSRRFSLKREPEPRRRVAARHTETLGYRTLSAA
jgi:hypothetical protein